MNEIDSFFSNVESADMRTILALMVPKSLTNYLAKEIVRRYAPNSCYADLFLVSLKISNFVKIRADEWRFREEIVELVEDRQQLEASQFFDINRFLISVATTATCSNDLPTYLCSIAGQAYHYAKMGESDYALKLYNKSIFDPRGFNSEIGKSLFKYQENRGALDKNNFRYSFFNAMQMYKSGDIEKSLSTFLKISEINDIETEIAVACHLSAVIIFSRNNGFCAKAEFAKISSLLNKSLDIANILDEPYHVSQVKHTFANVISEDPRRFDEAKKNYEESIFLEESIYGDHGGAKVLHSYAIFLSQNNYNFENTEPLINRSIGIEKRNGNLIGWARAELSKAIILSKSRKRDADARKSMKTAINIEHILENKFGLSVSYHAWANFEALRSKKSSFDRVEKLYRQSLKFANESGDKRQTAKVIHSYAIFIARDFRRRAEAEEMLMHSFRIDKESGNILGAAYVIHSLAVIVGKDKRRIIEARKLLMKSLRLCRGFEAERHKKIVANSLSRLDKSNKSARRRRGANNIDIDRSFIEWSRFDLNSEQILFNTRSTLR